MLNRLTELAQLFLKLGLISFGGPTAHVAMMEDEVVSRREWLSKAQFLDLLGATNLIPGPNSTEMAIHIGYVYAGWLGLIVAGVSFILPAVLIAIGLGWGYVSFGTMPQVAGLLDGIKPAVLGIVAAALWRLGHKAVKTSKLLTIGMFVAGLVWFVQVPEIIALLIGGITGMIWLQIPTSGSHSDRSTHLLVAGVTTGIALKASATTIALAKDIPVSLVQLGYSFLKIGSTLFGGGYVLISLVQSEFVDKYGWLTQSQLLDAISIGQFTPGPILSTATFIGYVIAGIPGSIVATVAIFLPSFFLVAATNPLIPHLRKSVWVAAFLDAVNVSAVALMVVVTIQLALSTIGLPPQVDWIAGSIAIGSTILGLRFQVSSAWLVLCGAIIGQIRFLISTN